jgi:hypothetical protein
MNIVVGYDAIRTNIPTLPKGAQVAGYSTGSGDVPWSAADFAAHPGALRIDQDAAASDATADYLDVENGAATFADCPVWAKAALHNWATGVRPGQRRPAIYMSASNVTNVVNALVFGGVAGGVGLVVANWNLSETQAVADVQAASGPFPVVGIQFKSGTTYDIDVYSGAWLADVSRHPQAGPFRQAMDGKETLEQYAASRDANTMNMLNRSIDHWDSADLEDITDMVLPLGFPVYTASP